VGSLINAVEYYFNKIKQDITTIETSTSYSCNNVRPCVPRHTLSRDESIVLEL